MKKIVRDMILNAIFALFGVAVALLIPTQVEKIRQEVQMGPDFFPYIAAGLMIFVNVLSLILNYIKYTKEKRADSDETLGAINLKDQLRVILVLAIVVAYVLLMPVVGYVISTLVMANVLLLILGVRKWYQYLLVSAFSMVIFYVFNNILHVMLP